MNKKVWYSIALIAVIIGLASAGTYAYLSANRTTSASRFAVGTLDLSVNGNNQLEPFVVEVGDDGSISGSKTWTIKNTGSLSGRLLVDLQNVVNLENGCNDHEKAAEPACEDDDEGELGAAIALKLALDGDDKIESSLATEEMSKLGDDWGNLAPIILEAGEEKTLIASWSADPSSYGNEIQSDSVEFDVSFRLIQSIKDAPTSI